MSVGAVLLFCCLSWNIGFIAGCLWTLRGSSYAEGWRDAMNVVNVPEIGRVSEGEGG